MPLLKGGKLTPDPWTLICDDDVIPGEGAVIVSLTRWREERERLILRGGPLGVRLTADQTPGELGEDLEFLDLVALEFPAFTDGRAYSNARRLRERYGFEGEVRAVGDVLRDQYRAMHRCGFDALEVRQGETEADWQRALGAITTSMQPATDGEETALSLRERRLAAG